MVPPEMPKAHPSPEPRIRLFQQNPRPSSGRFWLNAHVRVCGYTTSSPRPQAGARALAIASRGRRASLQYHGSGGTGTGTRRWNVALGLHICMEMETELRPATASALVIYHHQRCLDKGASVHTDCGRSWAVL